MRQIVVSNESTVVADADVQAAVAAVQTQITEHFAPAYSGLSAVLHFQHGKPAAGVEVCHVLDDSDQAGALGYHELKPQGFPEGFVFARTTQEAGDPWTTTLSHEILEQLLDPYANWGTQAQLGGQTVLVALEDADPVEGDSYPINGVAVSNFVLPAWFAGTGGKVDYLGKLSRGLSLDAGGYIAYTADGVNWQQLTGRHTAERHKGAPPFTRRARRLRHPPHLARRAGAVNWTNLLSDIQKVLQAAPQVLQVVGQLGGIFSGLGLAPVGSAPPSLPVVQAP
jgi:hypothetical protein